MAGQAELYGMAAAAELLKQLRQGNLKAAAAAHEGAGWVCPNPFALDTLNSLLASAEAASTIPSMRLLNSTAERELS